MLPEVGVLAAGRLHWSAVWLLLSASLLFLFFFDNSMCVMAGYSFFSYESGFGEQETSGRCSCVGARAGAKYTDKHQLTHRHTHALANTLARNVTHNNELTTTLLNSIFVGGLGTHRPFLFAMTSQVYGSICALFCRSKHITTRTHAHRTLFALHGPLYAVIFATRYFICKEKQEDNVLVSRFMCTGAGDGAVCLLNVLIFYC